MAELTCRGAFRMTTRYSSRRLATATDSASPAMTWHWSTVLPIRCSRLVHALARVRPRVEIRSRFRWKVCALARSISATLDRGGCELQIELVRQKAT